MTYISLKVQSMWSQMGQFYGREWQSMTKNPIPDRSVAAVLGRGSACACLKWFSLLSGLVRLLSQYAAIVKNFVKEIMVFYGWTVSECNFVIRYLE